jgi:hypothetical protein
MGDFGADRPELHAAGADTEATRLTWDDGSAAPSISAIVFGDHLVDPVVRIHPED